MAASRGRFSYAAHLSPAPQQTLSRSTVVKTSPKPKSNFLSEIGSSEKYLYGMIGIGIIVAVLFDAGVHSFKKSPVIGDRLNINGRIYVPIS